MRKTALRADLAAAKIAALLLLLLSACSLFLGEEHDNSPMGIFNRIWNDFNETYALFDERLQGESWEEVRKELSAHISPDMSNYALFEVCADMVNRLNDPHVALTAPFSHSDLFKQNPASRFPFDQESVRRQLQDRGNLTKDEMFLYGVFTDTPRAGYLFIKDFINDSRVGLELTQEWAKEIDGIVQWLQSGTDFLIIDVRNNRGGFGSNMTYIASRFISESKNYIQVSTKNGPGRNDFSAPVKFFVQPEGSRYSKPVVLLTNRHTASAAEWFTLALLTQSNVIHMGEASNGAFSARTDRLLVNGWIYSMSIQKVTGADGRQLEAVGISPNEEHRINNAPNIAFYGEDDQLKYARTLF